MEATDRHRRSRARSEAVSGRAAAWPSGAGTISTAWTSPRRKETRLTADGSPTLLNGELDWVYPEELDLSTAYWWSPDSKRIAYLQFDISREPVFPQVDLLRPHARFEPERYPKAGDPNADVRVGVVAAGGGPDALDGPGRDARLPASRASTGCPAASGVAVQRLNRIQNRLDLLVADPSTGAASAAAARAGSVLDQRQRHVPLPARTASTSCGAASATGSGILYLYSMDGKLLHALTRGEWEVTALAGVDEAREDRLLRFDRAEPARAASLPRGVRRQASRRG